MSPELLELAGLLWDLLCSIVWMGIGFTLWCYITRDRRVDREIKALYQLQLLRHDGGFTPARQAYEAALVDVARILRIELEE